MADRQISTTNSLSRFASRRSLANRSIAQKQIAPNTMMLRTPIKTDSILFFQLPFRDLAGEACDLERMAEIARDRIMRCAAEKITSTSWSWPPSSLADGEDNAGVQGQLLRGMER